ncbi:trigger factor [Atopobiaceae bacterium 24-176]
MNITVTAGDRVDSKLSADVTIPADDVNRAVAKAYKDVAKRYNFQGFRKGRAPRPVIDAAVGREAILADATNALLAAAEPLVLNELDVVPVGEVDFGEDLEPAQEKQDYKVKVTVNLIPESELSSYDPVAISMPPADATDAEVDQQLDVLMGYQARFEDADADHAVAAGDFVNVDVIDIENGDSLAGENRMLATGAGMLPGALEEALVGMKPGDEREVEFTQGEGDDAKTVKIKVKANDIKVKVTPELTDDFAKDVFGFDGIDALRDAVSIEIKNDKDRNLPALKEERAVTELEKRLEMETVPENYVKQVHDEIARQFVSDLQAQGQTVDSFLQMRHITIDQLLADLQEQATEHARQSIALDALAKHLGIEVTDDDVKAEFSDVYDSDKAVEKAMKEFEESGQMPAVRQTIRRSKAVTWLLDNAQVTEVDEIAEKRANN